MGWRIETSMMPPAMPSKVLSVVLSFCSAAAALSSFGPMAETRLDRGGLRAYEAGDGARQTQMHDCDQNRLRIRN